MPPSRKQTELQQAILLQLQHATNQTQAMLGQVVNALRRIEQEIHLLRMGENEQDGDVEANRDSR